MATTTYSSLFDANNVPISGYPSTIADIITFSFTVGTTNLDTLADFYGAIPVPLGFKIPLIGETHADLDSGGSPALDLDIILRIPLSDGTNQDTILYNAGTAFQAAVTAPVWTQLADTTTPGNGGIKIDSSTAGLKPLYNYGIVGFYCNTAAATAAAGAIVLTVMLRP